MENQIDRKRSNPKELTDIMVKDFTEHIKSLLRVTRDVEYVEFEKGLYATLFAKPSKRISRLLAIDREVLVLFTSFADQQARTIETATTLIDDSEGRLEHSVAIIVHGDKEGNSKLKNWGRETGLSVIPIFFETLSQTEEEIERSIFYEFFSHDAFDVSGPVSDDSKFYGRRSEAQDIARHLQAGQVRAALGMRKTGKTSLINRIISVSHNSHDCSTVMVDSSRDSVWQMTDAQLLNSIALACERSIDYPEKYVSIQRTREAIEIGEATEQLITAVSNSPRPVIVFFDEIDYITPGSPTTDKWTSQFIPFWRNLRAAYQEITRSGKRLSLFVGGVSSKWFHVESIGGIENAALAFIPEEYLSPLANGASVAMIKTLARTSGLQFDSDTAGHIAETCSNIPFWTRKACSFIHRNIAIENRPSVLSIEETTALTQDFIESEGATIAEVALNHLFRVYPEIEEPAIKLYQGERKGITQYHINTLEKYGFITKRAGAFFISGRMMSEGMRLFLEKKSTVKQSVQSGIEYQSLEDWAEDLALLNAARNKIEKRLRAITLNFIRFDALQNKQKGSLLERVSKYIEEPRRTKLRNLSPDELIEKFNWSDLTKLIEKEWSLFQGFFIDKAAFSLNAAIVNERYDAHAKNADKADVALYRRSLSWFEESLART